MKVTFNQPPEKSELFIHNLSAKDVFTFGSFTSGRTVDVDEVFLRGVKDDIICLNDGRSVFIEGAINLDRIPITLVDAELVVKGVK